MKTHAVVVALLALSACPPPAASTTDATSSSSTSSTSGTTEPTTSTTAAPTTSSTPDLPPPCPVGSLSCPCTLGGSCDPGLSCEDGACAESCAVGSLGCACTPGGGCDPGLKCDEAQTCVDDPMLSPPCMPQHDDCCGDGTIDDFEDCDLGLGANGDGEACTLQCKHAVCGDGLLHDPFEACDGEEFCSDECTFTTCGDGVVQPHEWCEKARPDDPECTDLCTDARKIVFITSTHYQGGSIGGVAGGDKACQEHASTAGLPGIFRAWLADSKANEPASTFDLSLPHVDVTGAFLFDATFCSQEFDLLDESGNTHSGASMPIDGTSMWAWWTHDFLPEYPTCVGWTNDEALGVAFKSQSCSVATAVPCGLSAPIVCVEQ